MARKIRGNNVIAFIGKIPALQTPGQMTLPAAMQKHNKVCAILVRPAARCNMDKYLFKFKLHGTPILIYALNQLLALFLSSNPAGGFEAAFKISLNISNILKTDRQTDHIIRQPSCLHRVCVNM